MSVLVCFHAHPDDEVFTTGGVMRLAADAGHRVVVVTATDGALGEVPDGLLGDGESLASRRRIELAESVAALGAHRSVLLGYADSGMAGTVDNDNPEAFCQVDVATAAERLAEILSEEKADVLTVYDDHGTYGHPDHIQVHRVGVLAARLAGVQHVYEATISREHVQALFAEQAATNPEAAPTGPSNPAEFGLPWAEITTVVDVSAAMPAKRAAMRAHATQMGDFEPFLAMDDDLLRVVFGQEWFRKRDATAGFSETSLPLD